MEIQIAQEELNTFNILQGHIDTISAELRASIAARDNYIRLLEAKYNATYDLKSGKLLSKDGKKPKKEVEKSVRKV